MSTLYTDINAFNERRIKKTPELAAFCLKTQQMCTHVKNKENLNYFTNEEDKIKKTWSELEESTSNLNNCALMVQQFIQSEKTLDKWLTIKTKMFFKLCGTLADLKLIDNHLVVVQMLESEYKDEENYWKNVNEHADKIIKSDCSPQFREVVVQNVNEINKRWKDLGENIMKRNNMLNSIQSLGIKFETLYETIKYSLLSAGEEINSAINLSNDIEAERSLKIKKLDETEFAIKNLNESVFNLKELLAQIQKIILDDVALHTNIDEKIITTERHIDELLRKIEIVRSVAASTIVEKSEIISELDTLLQCIKHQAIEFETHSLLPLESQKLNVYAKNFEKMLFEIYDYESKIIILNSKITDLLNRSPDADLKQKLLLLNEKWQPLLAATKTRQQNLERVNKLFEELTSLEKEIVDSINLNNKEIEELKKSSDFNINFGPTEARLNSLESKVNLAFEILVKLDSIENVSSSDLKKRKLKFEELKRNRNNVLEDCQLFINHSRAMNDLQYKFDAVVKMMYSFLDSTRNDFKLGNDFSEKERITIGKDSYLTGLNNFESKWKQYYEELNLISNKLNKITDTNINVEIKEAQDELETNYKELYNVFEQTITELEKNEYTFNKILERGHQEFVNVTNLLNKIDAISPIGRELNILNEQKEEADQYLKSLDEKIKIINTIIEEWNKELGDKNVNSLQKTVLIDLDRLTHQIDRSRAEIGQRKRAIINTHTRIENLSKSITEVLADMEKAKSSEIFVQLLNTDLVELKNRQNLIKQFKNSNLRLISDKLDEITSICKELIRSSSPEVSTRELENSMGQIAAKWQELSVLVEDCEREIDSSVQGLGSYNDAHTALLNWLEEAEELLKSQKPPSADYKVIKAQIQNHDFQLKLINDKKQSVEGFLLMIEKLKLLNNNDEQKLQLQMKASEISDRYDDLLTNANNRHTQLIDAQELTYEFSQLTQNLTKFLDNTNKNLQAFSKIPTDTERLEEQIKFQTELQEQTDEMRSDFDRLVEMYSKIVTFVNIEDSNELEATVRNLTFRYNEIGTRCQKCGQLLAALAEDISSFIQNTNQLSEWLDSAEKEIEKFGQISSIPEELVEQSEELTKLAIAVAEQGALVSQVVEESRELCTHASGSEAIALQYRIDCLRNRYSQLTVEAEQKIAILSKAIPLSEELREGFYEINEFLNGVEEDLENLNHVLLDDQFQLMETINTEINQFRIHLDEELQPICLELQRLSCESKANELAKESNEILHRFNAISDLVNRKSEQLKSVERQSRYTFDVLDFWIDWFNEIKENIIQSEKPSVDIEFLKAQLKQQRLLNEEISSERAGLRNIIVDASKIARDLNSSFVTQDNELLNKADKTKKLAEETAELGLDRIAELEQALVLCKELDESYTELSDWMDETEHELQNCDSITTGMSPKALIQQQLHNNKMLQAIQSQRSLISKFERNITALSELCSETDSKSLRQISDSIAERFNELSTAFRERGDALASTIEQSSEFSDRLNLFLTNLQGALNQIRHSEPASARLPILQQQIADNLEILELIKQKVDSFKTMKSNAQEVLLQAKGNEPAVREIAQNIEVLDDLWLELNSSSTAQHSFLTETLRRAELFWAEYKKCQNGILLLGQNFDAVQLEITQLEPGQTIIGQQKLAALSNQFNGSILTNIESMRAAGALLCESLNDDERTYVEQHLILFDSNWNALSQLFLQISANLSSNIDKTNNFYENLSRYQLWFTNIEARIAELFQKVFTNNAEVRDELAHVNALRREFDENALQREHLNHFAAEICANSSPAQVNTIRGVMNDLNQHWNKSNALLTEHFQRLEKTLLDMGQFTHACDQLSVWIDKTKDVLDNINLDPESLKHVEIELCKFSVVQNDIYAHLQSYEAIQNTGKALIKAEPESAAIKQPLLDSLTERWNNLSEQAERIWTELEMAKAAAGHRSSELEKWALWLSDILVELKSNKPIGSFPETAQAQLDDFRIIAADIEQKRDDLESELEHLEQYFATSSTSSVTEGENANDKQKKSKKQKLNDTYLEKKFSQLKNDWESVQMKLLEREGKLIDALREAIELQNGIHEISDWIMDAETHLSLSYTVFRLPDSVRKQLADHAVFNESVQSKKERMKELHNKGIRLQLSCEKKDAISMKNKLISLKHSIDKIVLRNSERTRQLENAANESQLYFDSHDELVEWIDASNIQLENQSIDTLTNTGCKIRDFLESHKIFYDQINRRSSAYESTYQRGKLLEDQALSTEKKAIVKSNAILKEKWDNLNAKSIKQQRSLEEALAQSGKFEEIMAEMLSWFDANLPQLEADIASENQMGDVDTIHALLAEHFSQIVEAIDAHRSNLEKLRQRAQEIISSAETGTNDNSQNEKINHVKKQLERVNDEWNRMESASAKKEECLTKSLTKAVDLSESLHEFQDFVTDTETKIRRIPIPSEETLILNEMEHLERLRSVISHKTVEYFKILDLARHIHANCHPRAELVMRDLIRSLTGRWELLDQLVKEKNEKLESRLNLISKHEKQLSSLLEFIDEKKSELAIISGSDDHGKLPALMILISEHALFLQSLNSRQSDVDEAIKIMKKTNASAVQIQVLPTNSSTGKLANDDSSLKKNVMVSSITASSKLSKNGNLTDKNITRSARQQKTDKMAEKWKSLLADTLAYEERLKARCQHLQELKRLESFTFDKWRERYLAWNDHGKARISDLFRRIDKSGTGVVPRKQFIDGILVSKFPTSELEMSKVADEFDKGDGLISAKEFMNALRFDPKKRRYEPKTERERIHEEIARETSRCTCAHRFPIQHILSENSDNRVQYGFGFGNTIKRMVRILRSTVMVRVGGGWEPLDKFLLKHDPCRAKGRINIDMMYGKNRSNFGSTDIASFTSRKNTNPLQQVSPNSDLFTPVTSTGYRYGPIMKIREKTERSVPMFKKPTTPKSPSSNLFSTPFQQPKRKASDDLIFNETRIPAPKSSSRSSSRQNLFESGSYSRPASRCSSLAGSDISDILRSTRIPSLRGSKSSSSSSNSKTNNQNVISSDEASPSLDLF